MDAHPVCSADPDRESQGWYSLANPTSSQVDLDDNLRIWRNFKMGKLMDLIVLDTRHYDRSITTLGMCRH